MQALNTKVNNGGTSTAGVLSASEFNNLSTEIQNAITAANITLSSGDLTQLGQSLANHASCGDYYTAGGTANAITLTTVAGRYAAPVYVNGMRLRFRATNNNTGATTIKLNALATKSVVSYLNAALVSGQILSGTEYTVIYDSTSDNFELQDLPTPSATETVAGKAEIATQAETNAGTDDTTIVTPLKLATWATSTAVRKKLTATTYSAVGKYTIAHGFGSTPEDVSVIFQLKSAQTDLSYSYPRSFIVSNNTDNGGGNAGVSISFDSTNVYINVSTTGMALIDNSATPVIGFASTASKWEFVVTVHA